MTNPTIQATPDDGVQRGTGGPVAGLLFAVLAGPAAIGAHWLVFRAMPKERDAEEYFLTGLLAANYDGVTALVFGVAGFAIARRFATAPLLVGLGMVVLFPIGMAVEMARSPTSHNLLPFEILGYCGYALPATVGAWIARRANRR